MMTTAEAQLWIERWLRWHEARVLFVDLIAEHEPPDGYTDETAPAQFARFWRISCGRIGVAEATADEMRDPVARRATLRRAVRLARISGSVRRDIRAVLKYDPAYDASFARWRAICPALG